MCAVGLAASGHLDGVQVDSPQRASPALYEHVRTRACVYEVSVQQMPRAMRGARVSGSREMPAVSNTPGRAPCAGPAVRSLTTPTAWRGGLAVAASRAPKKIGGRRIHDGERAN